MAWMWRGGLAWGVVLAIAAGGLVSVATGLAERAGAAERARATTLFVFTYRPGPSWQAGVPMIKQGLGPHGAYIRGLLDDGRLFAGGGFVNTDGGMAIVYAESLDEARAILAADPAVTSGIFVGAIEQWRPRFHSQAPLIRE